MRVLLDTHIALWAIADDPRLPDLARSIIDDPENAIVVSAATIWEISIKNALSRGGPNDVTISGAEAMAFFQEAGFDLLAITPAHAAAVRDLPPLHADPFDRMLIAQALAEPLRLMTRDARIIAYGGVVLPV